MNAPAAIMGTFVALTPVASRKVVRLHIECAIEHADQILHALGGYPDPANPKHVAVARLNAGSAPKEKWIPEYQNPAKTCALLCQKESFWNFISERGKRCENEADAAEYVRHQCGVNTRADFATNPVALRKWQVIERAYEAWFSKVSP